MFLLDRMDEVQLDQSRCLLKTVTDNRQIALQNNSLVYTSSNSQCCLLRYLQQHLKLIVFNFANLVDKKCYNNLNFSYHKEFKYFLKCSLVLQISFGFAFQLLVSCDMYACVIFMRSKLLLFSYMAPISFVPSVLKCHSLWPQ